LLVEQDVLLSREANGLLRELQEAGRALQEPLSRYRETLSRISAFVEDGDRMDEGAQAAVADVQSALSGVERYYEDAVNRIYGMADFLAGKYDPPPS
jgi:hypothetical protein